MPTSSSIKTINSSFYTYLCFIFQFKHYDGIFNLHEIYYLLLYEIPGRLWELKKFWKNTRDNIWSRNNYQMKMNEIDINIFAGWEKFVIKKWPTVGRAADRDKRDECWGNPIRGCVVHNWLKGFHPLKLKLPTDNNGNAYVERFLCWFNIPLGCALS